MKPEEADLIILKAQQEGVLSLDAIDRLLKEDATFDTNLKKLTLNLNGCVEVEVPREEQGKVGARTRGGRNGATRSSRQGTYTFYRGELRNRPKMSREEERRFAKRLEFYKSRMIQAVHTSGLPATEAAYYLKHTRCLDHPSSKPRGPLCEELKVCPKGKKDQIHITCQAYNKCRSIFVERNLYLVVIVTLPYRTYGIPLMDLIQEGNAALIRAVEKFDWRKGVRLQTYAEFWIKQAVERSINANKNIVRVPTYMQQRIRRFRREGKLPVEKDHISSQEVSKIFDLSNDIARHLLETDRGHVSLNALIAGEGNLSLSDHLAAESAEPAPEEEAQQLKETLDQALEHLSEQERTILMHRYGLNGAEFKTMAELGEMMNLSREGIRQIQLRSIQKLQKPSLMERLSSYL
jgi:RNA polymerase sigma factor (sigma-70 family)